MRKTECDIDILFCLSAGFYGALTGGLFVKRFFCA